MGDRDRPCLFRRALPAVLVLLSLPAPIVAQFVQYTPPGFLEPRREDTEKILERHMAEARWKLGRMYLDPWIGMRDSGYRDPVAGTDESDVTVTIGLGLRAWLPVRSDFTVAAHVLPEYTWWSEFSERNVWNGRYGAGLFGNLGRTGMELTARLDEHATFFSREFEEQVNSRQERVKAKFEVDAGAGFEIFFGGSVTALDYETEELLDRPSPGVVDRDEDLVTVGVNYVFPYGFTAGLGAEYSRAEFEPGVSDRSNSGTAPVFLFDFAGTQLFMTGNIAFRSLTPDDDSLFVGFDGVTGRFQFSWKTVGRLELQLYASNQLVYSFTDTWAYFEDAPVGIGLRYAIARWVRARVFGETGSDDYIPFAEDGPPRSDDFDGWGASLEFQLSRIWLDFQYSQTDYDSNFDSFDRRFRRLGFLVGVGPGDGASWR